FSHGGTRTYTDEKGAIRGNQRRSVARNQPCMVVCLSPERQRARRFALTGRTSRIGGLSVFVRRGVARRLLGSPPSPFRLPPSQNASLQPCCYRAQVASFWGREQDVRHAADAGGGAGEVLRARYVPLPQRQWAA